MRHVLRLLLVLFLALLAGPAIAPPAEAGDDATPGDCICLKGAGACQHYLRNPKKPTDDPCWCPKCAGGPVRHDGKSVPKGWNATCFMDKGEENYLKRHAAAWGIVCSECVENTATCKGTVASCPACSASAPDAKDYAGRNAKRTVAERLAKERKFFKGGDGVRVLYGKDFYLVTDVPSMKVATSPTTWRVLGGHEWAHLMMERAAYARREFASHLGDALLIEKPTGMYIPVDRRDGNKLALTYLGNELANILYGGTDKSTVADAFCFHGFVISMEQFGSGNDDKQIHFAMRHMIGHELISCWVVVDGLNRALPRWLHEGTAHWLSRLQPRFREDAFACHLEGTVLELPGTKWDQELRSIAAASKPGAIETLFAKDAQGQLTADDHRRAWSYMDLCLREWREPWVAMLRALRKRTPPRDAFVAHLAVTPEVFDERWRERISGRRKSMDPSKSDAPAVTNEKLGARERAAMRAERDPATLAALIRGLGTVSDGETAKLVVDLLAKDQPLVRETALVALLDIKDDATRDAAWKHGLAHTDPMVRAYAARLCAERAIAAAVPLLREQLADANWYARAEAALTLGKLGDADSMTRVMKLVDDSADKARVAAMDALAMFGARSEPAAAAIAKHLSSAHWQLRVTASQALGAIGSMESVDPLIDRMETESGRVRRDIQDALRKITRDDLGQRPENWRAWWDKQKAANAGRIPGRPADPGAKPPQPANDPHSTTALPQYFGIELFGNRVAFVLDASGSMNIRFVPDDADQARRGRRLRGVTKFEMSKAEIAEAIGTLDPRSHFNLVSFGDNVDSWKKEPSPASKDNVADAIDWLRVKQTAGETNYYDAMRLVLDLGERPDSTPFFRDTPDTITFLTDGMPTRGDITAPKALLSWFTNLNRYARVTTHIIAFGDKGLEVEFLKGLAEKNWGTFVHVHGRDG